MVMRVQDNWVYLLEDQTENVDGQLEEGERAAVGRWRGGVYGFGFTLPSSPEMVNGGFLGGVHGDVDGYFTGGVYRVVAGNLSRSLDRRGDVMSFGPGVGSRRVLAVRIGRPQRGRR